MFLVCVLWGLLRGSCPPGKCFFGGWEMSEFGGGKCPNFGGGKCPPGKWLTIVLVSKSCCQFQGLGFNTKWGRSSGDGVPSQFTFASKSYFYFSGSFCFYLQAKSFLFVRKFLTQLMWTKTEASCLKNSCVWVYLDKFFSEKIQSLLSYKIFQFSIWCSGPWSSNDQFEQGGNTAVHGGDIEVEPMSPHVHEQPPTCK